MNKLFSFVIAILFLFQPFGVQARFSQADPYPGELHEPISLHQYTYVHNNPTNLVDPSGQIATVNDLLQAMNLQGINTTTGTHAAYRVTLKVGKKMACVAIDSMVSELILQQLTGGIYIFEDSKKTPSKPYIGHSQNMEKRLRQHAQSKTRKVKKVLSMFHMEGSKNDLRLIEQFFMDILSKNNINTTNINLAIAETPRSQNSKDLRKILGKLDFCK